jgi:hypothetical protein
MSAGKGDKWRKTNFKKYYNNFPKDMGPKPLPNKLLSVEEASAQIAKLTNTRPGIFIV